MPVSTSCPDCGRQYHRADRLLDKMIRCKECGVAFRVGEEPAGKTRPEKCSASRTRPDHWEEDDRPRRRSRQKADRSGLWISLAVGGGVLLVLLFAGALLLRNRLARKNAPADQPGSSVAQTSSPQSECVESRMDAQKFQSESRGA